MLNAKKNKMLKIATLFMKVIDLILKPFKQDLWNNNSIIYDINQNKLYLLKLLLVKNIVRKNKG